MGLDADREEGLHLMHLEQAGEVQVTAVHDVESARFWRHWIRDIDVVESPVGDMDEGRDIAAQVRQCT